MTCITCAMLISCSGGPASKTITATSTEFTSGDLARYIAVAEDETEAELVFTTRDGAIPTQYLRLKVTLEKVKSGFEDVDARDINFTGLWSVAVINLVDEYGTEVQDIDIKSEDCLKLKKLLTEPLHSKAEILFEGEYHTDSAPKWFKSTVQFTPYLTADISIGTSETSANTRSTSGTSSDSDGVASAVNAFKALLEIAESLDDDDDDDSWFDDDDDDDDDSWFDDDDDDDSIDEFIAGYEKFFKQYMTILKKIGNNDMSVLGDYATMLTEYQSYSKKLAKMQNKMSTGQYNRLNKMNLELLSEIQKM